MSNSLSNNLLEQIYGQYSDVPLLMLVTISHSSFDTLYLVDNIEDQISRGNTFRAFPMRVRPPADDGETVREVAIDFDNVSLELIQELRSVTTPMDVTVEVVLANDPDFVQIEYRDLKMKAVSYDAQKISAKLYLDDFLSVGLTSEVYSPSNYPGLF